MAILDQYQFHVASDLTQLDHVLTQSSQINRYDLIPLHDWMQCQMAIAEGFTNAVRHAHGEELKNCPITIDLRLYSHRLDIRIWDHSAHDFDLDHHLATLDTRLNEYASGGRGFIILKKIADTLAYRYDATQQQSYLLIKKRLKSRLSPYFISTEGLHDRLGDRNLVIIDCRFRLGDTDWGEQQYRLGHIPGAYYLHLDRDLSAPVSTHGGRHPLPKVEDFVQVLSRLGIERGVTEVVIYDDFRFAFAARLWWLLKYVGHDNVSLLDGSFQAWQQDDLPLSTDIPADQNLDFVPQVRDQLLITRNTLLKEKNPLRILIDARDGDRYLGKHEPIDPIAGHVPCAINSPWKQVSTEDGYAVTYDQQKQIWQALELDQAEEIVLYCGSGVTACVNWLSLELTGHTNLKLYAGGWSDWCSYLPQEASPQMAD
ncbi:MAG: thiosulfate sulfurtransferase [Limnothrix sp. RL_2_0]|nr:thiosulfate sulfurtransferase [Limnothrix sp. RL_2_0]